MKRKCKTKFKDSSIPRTDGWKSQPQYDAMLSDLSVSSLRYLKYKLIKDLENFKNKTFSNVENLTTYKQLKQRIGMVREELYSRDIMDTKPVEDYFDVETGIVYDSEGTIKYNISLNEKEDGYVIHNVIEDTRLSVIFEEDTDEDEINIVPIKVGLKVVGYSVRDSNKSLEQIYKDWEYGSDND